MQVRRFFGSALLAAGLLMAGCGGAESDPMEQAVPGDEPEVTQAGPPCDYCIQRRNRCLDSATTVEEEEWCLDDFLKCRDDWCRAGLPR